MITPNRLLWFPSLVAAVVVHGLAILALALVSSEPPGAQAEGVGGLRVGYAGGGSRGQPATRPATRQSQSAIIEAVVPTVVRPKLQQRQVTRPVVKVPAIPPLPRPVVLPPVKQVVLPPVAKLAKQAVARQKPSAMVRQTKEPVSESATKDVMAAASPLGIRQATQSQGEGAGSSVPGSGNSTQGGGNPGVIKDYRSVIRAWLEQHKSYPKRALRRRQQGVAMLYFEIDRNGHVIMHEIRHSSGYSILDRAVYAMLRRASPLPEAPLEVSTEELKFIVPVTFNIH